MSLFEFTNRQEHGSRFTIPQMDAILDSIKDAINTKEIFRFPKHSTLSSGDVGKLLMIEEEAGVSKARVYARTAEQAGTPGEWTVEINALSKVYQGYWKCDVTFSNLPTDGDTITLKDLGVGNFRQVFTFRDAPAGPVEIQIAGTIEDTLTNAEDTITNWIEAECFQNIASVAALPTILRFNTTAFYNSMDNNWLYLEVDGDTRFTVENAGEFSGKTAASYFKMFKENDQTPYAYTPDNWNHAGAPNGATPADTTEEAGNFAAWIDANNGVGEDFEGLSADSTGNIVTITQDDPPAFEQGVHSFNVQDWDAEITTVTVPEETVPESAQADFIGILEAIEGSEAIIRRPIVETFTLEAGAETDLSDRISCILVPSTNPAKVMNTQSFYDFAGMCGWAIESKTTGTVKALTNIPIIALLQTIGQ